MDDRFVRNLGALTEEDCRKIIAEAPAPDAAPKTRRFKKRS